ncbi:hypothetical protein E2C01_087727 [Portunus trituberculatus]|uniref:Uncharacterized protein n=1 Tax=Portunus trituberculatus TaxID=210409 RepID=A0A5B7JH92_PORTR|nr:hypothetical protein [Portunus trituberculatus]
MSSRTARESYTRGKRRYFSREGLTGVAPPATLLIKRNGATFAPRRPCEMFSERRFSLLAANTSRDPLPCLSLAATACDQSLGISTVLHRSTTGRTCVRQRSVVLLDSDDTMFRRNRIWMNRRRDLKENTVKECIR